jgi:hypothetical protein
MQPKRGAIIRTLGDLRYRGAGSATQGITVAGWLAGAFSTGQLIF